MANFFERSETSSQAERDNMTRSLQELHSIFDEYRKEALRNLSETLGTPDYLNARINHTYAIGGLIAIQAVFGVLGIEFDGLYNLEV